MKKRINPDYWELAQQYRQRLTQIPPSLPSMFELRHVSNEVQDLHRQIHRAGEREYFLAARRLRLDLVDLVRRLHTEALLFVAKLEERPSAPVIQSPSEIYADLKSLEREFKKVECDLDKPGISVVTDDVFLDDICFGPFQIALELPAAGQAATYRVIALEPYPAGGREEVTHPHVSDGHLCEGDGHGPIRRALESGRLLDFFQIVDRLLHTYAVGAAFVELERWSGRTCYDCGERIPADEDVTCPNCEELVCQSCTSYCEHCHDSCCGSCIHRCPDCEESCCSTCLVTCQSCRRRVCPTCVRNNQCLSCQEPTDEPSEPADDGNTGDTNTGDNGGESSESECCECNEYEAFRDLDEDQSLGESADPGTLAVVLGSFTEPFAQAPAHI